MSTILKSLFGSQFGIDKDGYLTTNVGIKVPAVFVGASGSEIQSADTSVTSATSATTATAITNTGLTLITSTGQAFTLAAPTAAGLRKRVVQTSAGTGITVTLASGTFNGTNTVATFTAKNANLDLVAVTTAYFSVTNNSSLGSLIVLS